MRGLLIVALIIAILAVIFALQNANLVTINFLLWKVSVSLALVLLIILVVGIIVGLLVAGSGWLKKNWELSAHKKKIQEIKKILTEKNATLDSQYKRIKYLEKNLQGSMEKPRLLEQKDKDYE